MRYFLHAIPALLVSLTSLSSVNAAPVDNFELVARQSSSCYPGVYVISARGTFEPQNASLSDTTAQAIVDAIPGSARIQVQYPGDVNPLSPDQGYRNMKKMVEDYYSICPRSKIVLMGYSQGALVTGNVIANTVPQWSVGDSIKKQIVSVVMFGDPGRNKGLGDESFQKPDPTCQVDSFFPRSGDALKQMTQFADRLVEVCHSGDFVCCTTGNSFYDHVGYFTNERARAIASFVKSKL